MARLTYAEQLKHPNWQRVRMAQLDAAGYQCQACRAHGGSLHVHHKRYIKGRMAWEYAAEELEVLCANCHKQHHNVEDEFKETLAINARAVPEIASQAMAVAAGFAAERLGDGQLAALYGKEYLAGMLAQVVCSDAWAVFTMDDLGALTRALCHDEFRRALMDSVAGL